jgi:hypothetical protein
VFDEERSFVYLHAKSDEEFAAVRKDMENFAACLWRDLFEHKPEQPLYIVLLTTQDSPKVMPAGVGGFFSDGANALFCGDMPINKLMRNSVVTHEFTHSLHSADRAVRRQEHPIWCVEGLATLFETSKRDGDKVTPLPNQRLALLKQAVKGDRSIPWAYFTRMSQGQFMQMAGVAYAQARYMFLYLYERNLLKAFYDEYTKSASYEGDKSALEAFEVVFGKPAAEVERDWKQWVLKQESPAIPYLGVQTEEQKDRLVVKSVVESSAAAAAGINKDDVLVSVEGTPTRTQSDFMEVLGKHNVGEEVDIIIERGGKPITIAATLRARPAEFGERQGQAARLGLSVEEVEGQIRVREVEKDSPAAKAGVDIGWRILKFDQAEIKSVRDFLAALKKSKPGQTVELTVQKPGQDPTTVKIELAAVSAEKE